MIPSQQRSKVTIIRRPDPSQTHQPDSHDSSLDTDQLLKLQPFNRAQERFSYAPNSRVAIASRMDHKYSQRQDDPYGLKSSSQQLDQPQQRYGGLENLRVQNKEERPSNSNMSYKSIDNKYGLVVRKLERPSNFGNNGELYKSYIFPNRKYFDINEPVAFQANMFDNQSRGQSFQSAFFDKNNFPHEKNSFDDLSMTDNFIFLKVNADQYKPETEYALPLKALNKQEQELKASSSLHKSMTKEEEAQIHSHKLAYEPSVIVTNFGKYKGDIINGKMNGQGILSDSNNAVVYEGSFTDDMFDGYGVFCNPIGLAMNEKGGENFQVVEKEQIYKDLGYVGSNWQKYEGIFKNDKKHKIGFWHLTCGDIFLGEFSEDKASGYGVYTLANGFTITGIWKDNKLVETL